MIRLVMRVPCSKITLLMLKSSTLTRTSSYAFSLSRAHSASSDESNTYSPARDAPAAFRDSEELLKERYRLRVDEDIEKKRSRLLYQSRKRGMLENGVILASFADKFLSKFNAKQLDQYDRLINLPTNDWDIYYWAIETKSTPPEFETPVMQQLREHLRSKVSNVFDNKINVGDSGDGKSSDIYRKRLDDIAMPAVKRKYRLDIDASEVDLMNYKEELYDDRITAKNKKGYLVEMTQWRKNMFLKRIRRTISSPVSVKNMDANKNIEVFTQKPNQNTIGRLEAPQTDSIDSSYDKYIKHHNFVQYLLASNFTNDARDYDDEAEAWSEIMWHRNYGSSDVRLAPSHKKCSSCFVNLQCCNHGLLGYVPRELFVKMINSHLNDESVICQRCKFSELYHISPGMDVPEGTFLNLLSDLKDKEPSVICLLVDLIDFPSSVCADIVNKIGIHHKILIVGNKLDMLPFDGFHMLDQVKLSLRNSLTNLRMGEKNQYIQDVLLVSARTGFGVESLVSKLFDLSNEKRLNMYLVGSSNSGKSTLFNALLQSDLSAIRKSDLVSRISSFCLPSSSMKMLSFPVAKLEGWELELKRRKRDILERNTRHQIKNLASTSERRQDAMPHMSLLLDCLNYPLQTPRLATSVSFSTLPQVQEVENKQPQFSEDHPFQQITKLDPFSASSEEFKENAHFHMIPSSVYQNQLHDLLTTEERLEVFPTETIVPRKYSLRPLESVFIAGLARLDLLTAQSNVIITIFASSYLPIHIIPTRKADQFYKTFLGSLYLGVPKATIRGHRGQQQLKDWPSLVQGNDDIYVKGETLESGKDIVFSSFGWALVRPRLDQECIVRAYTPAGKGISVRDIPLLLCSKGLKGKKIRDTPLFEHPHYTIERSKTRI